MTLFALELRRPALYAEWRHHDAGSLARCLYAARMEWPHLDRRVVPLDAPRFVVVEVEAGESWMFEQDEDAPRRVAS